MPSYDFIQNPIVPETPYTTQPPMPMSYEQQTQRYNQFQQGQQVPQQPAPVKTGGFHFTIKPDDNVPTDPKLTIPINDPNLLPEEPKKHRVSNKPATIDHNEIVKATGTVEEPSTINSYSQTTYLLSNTVDQIDMVSSEIKSELDVVRNSRTMKGKYTYMSNLAGNLSDLLLAKVRALSEINSAISKSNDLDYKIMKDRKDAQSAVNDDKAVMDMYNAFISAPNTTQAALGPNPIQTASVGSGIIRANVGGSTNNISSPIGMNPDDAGFLNYMSRATPEQNAMFYENDPNVKTVVVFDASNGNKFFQVMNVSTGQIVPNVPVLDNRFMEDTTIDIRNHIAKNNNLHQTYPVIVLNENQVKEY